MLFIHYLTILQTQLKPLAPFLIISGWISIHSYLICSLSSSIFAVIKVKSLFSIKSSPIEWGLVTWLAIPRIYFYQSIRWKSLTKMGRRTILLKTNVPIRNISLFRIRGYFRFWSYLHIQSSFKFRFFYNYLSNALRGHFFQLTI